MLSRADQSTEPERAWLEDHFPQAHLPGADADRGRPAAPFPFIPNFGFTLGLELVREGPGNRCAR